MNTLDQWLISADQALRTMAGGAHAARPCPGQVDEEPLSVEARRTAGPLMRVNHVGEVCAQALYQAQALTADRPEMRQRMQAAARDEMDHLAWTAQRLRELGDRPSFLNPLWYAGSFAIGLVAGRMGEANSLGFVVETERQVEQHLASHLDRLPASDGRSRAIVEQMRDDERRHADEALDAGGRRLPLPVRWMMRAAAKVMTTTAHRI
jgi:3-demethoxyubiquinol 3-hydroxylase